MLLLTPIHLFDSYSVLKIQAIFMANTLFAVFIFSVVPEKMRTLITIRGVSKKSSHSKIPGELK